MQAEKSKIEYVDKCNEPKLQLRNMEMVKFRNEMKRKKQRKKVKKNEIVENFVAVSK